MTTNIELEERHNTLAERQVKELDEGDWFIFDGTLYHLVRERGFSQVPDVLAFDTKMNMPCSMRKDVYVTPVRSVIIDYMV